jgi:mannose-6-phosphate isomerase-like protein (cupin superfamily)
MPDWTRTNFGDLRDVSPQDVQVQWRFAREALGSPELGVSRFTYDPGARMPWGHRHRVQEEVYVVVAGSGRAKLDDEIVELSIWDVLRVAPAVVRSFEAGPEGLDVICIGGRKPKGREGRPYPVELPPVPGIEAAGEVVAAGPDADPTLVGRPVVHFGHMAGV